MLRVGPPLEDPVVHEAAELATGLALGTASASLLDFDPRQDPESVGLTNGVVSAAGLGLWALASSAVQCFQEAH